MADEMNPVFVLWVIRQAAPRNVHVRNAFASQNVGEERMFILFFTMINYHE